MPLPQNNESLPMGRYTTPVVGRLIAMPTTRGNINVAALQKRLGLRTGIVAFDFPSMPDVIELARSADYYTNFSPVMPDGMHQYRGTKPLEIPLTFKLHAMDRTYCPYGALTLLQLAARLHSFVLPLTSDGSTGAQARPLTVAGLSAANPQKTDTATPQPGGESVEWAYDKTLNTNVHGLDLKNGQVGVPFPPVTCLLNLIWVAEKQPGISCIGYIRDVRVRLMGPWLRGSTGEYNLPTAGEFEFTFIHHPSHQNAMGFEVNTATGQFKSTPLLPEMQAYATDVRDQLYNTRNLVLMLNYHGFDNVPANPAAANPAINIPPAAVQPLGGIYDPRQSPA